MVEFDKVVSLMVRQKAGLFSFKELYGFAYRWLTTEEYDVDEKEYTEKVKPYGKEIFIEWRARRRISDYFRFYIQVVFVVLGMTEVEVQKDGQKIKLNRGEIRIDVNVFLEKDYENRWETSPIAKFMRGIYDRYIIRGRILQYEIKIREEAMNFVDQIKAFLALETRKFA
ncbi:hypothetical protein B6U80_02380 [Candidatus Pacearchaeota archaeon ex4484_26]|nr:MAG: hypothetical protein B6U80_02380 [Candidatus Pacearchaeota archaeon ex4484_26]